MVSILVVYGSREGQTAKISERIVEVFDGRGHDATAVAVEDITPETSGETFDAILVGSSIHLGKHAKDIYEFVRENRDVLEARPNGFFQVSLSSANPNEEVQAEAAAYIDEFVEGTEWHPDRIAKFGGALRYSEYGFLTRFMMKRIAKDATGDTDTSRDYEYTDWDEVESFAADFAALVETGDVSAGGESEETQA
ncbi:MULTISPECIES: flavodoxin domain-containing protein [Haloferax]|uniref:Protoporphyrinogen oxidase n=1 Tax=Haloferax marinum TaxID=2666143 RepID=A0A6A8G9S3_9EURY|nr:MULTISPECIES: flavodoxin domain-containing protein [Haloferax]KAB1198707.1 protoporphyrinogen oxidase [Haloferax sp. CBA1150]MRW97824.1 protoporphyrinogen oxidase [Haloferax marinum]